MKRVSLAVVIILLSCGVAFAQSPASNKAFFASNLQNIKVASVGPTDGWTDAITVFDIGQALKTSNVGAVSATLSMEAALWTYNMVEATVNGGKQTSSSRAAIKAWVEIDGVKMEPGKVVYADRLQATGLELKNWTCTLIGVDGSCVIDGEVALELFQRTKSANAFTFFLGPLDAKIHSVVVKAQGLVECRANGEPVPCTRTTLDGYTAQTKAVIGKATLIIEEQNNWGRQ